jgi:hypothetical protein
VISEKQFGELIAILGRIAVGLERMSAPPVRGVPMPVDATRYSPGGPAAVPIYPRHYPDLPGMAPAPGFVPTPITMVGSPVPSSAPGAGIDPANDKTVVPR